MKRELKYEYDDVKKLFLTEEEFSHWNNWIESNKKEQYFRHFGDYQTPELLVDRIYDLLSSKSIQFESIIEPTAGKGNFILGGLKRYDEIKHVLAVDIQKHYIYLLKKELIDKKHLKKNMEFDILNDNIFDFDLSSYMSNKTLIIGNPPWITNSELSSLDSNNHPSKVNFKKHRGLEAMTGKSNFDIAEYILIMLLNSLKESVVLEKGTIAFLVKKIVATNILKSVKENKWNISSFEIYNIDAKKEFNVSTDACLVLISVDKNIENQVITAKEYSIYETNTIINEFGWVGKNFVSNVAAYNQYKDIDNNKSTSFFTWRSGVKHDASRVMELDYSKNGFHAIAKDGTRFGIDEKNIYPLYKSSDIRKITAEYTPQKYVIVTQKSVSEDTSMIMKTNIHLWNYLEKNSEKLDARKSSIYNGKYRFSMFGVGVYSFENFKIAISGMYKNSKFALVPPFNKKPVMFDDTVYFVSTNIEHEAYILFGLLNHSLVQKFLASISFIGNKRPYTKDILQRINIEAVLAELTVMDVNNVLRNNDYEYIVSADAYKEFKEKISVIGKI